MLSSVQLRMLLEKKIFRRYFHLRVVCGRDELPRQVGLRPAVFIVNTLPTYDLRVGHWICCVFKNSIVGNEVLFFDSLGRHYNYYHEDIVNFLRSNSFKITVCARYAVQSLSSNMCGWYCLYFLVGFIKRVGITYIMQRLLETSEDRMVYILKAMH